MLLSAVRARTRAAASLLDLLAKSHQATSNAIGTASGHQVAVEQAHQFQQQSCISSSGAGSLASYYQRGGTGRREEYHATTILCVRKDGQVVLIGDGQVSQGSTIAKPNAKKVGSAMLVSEGALPGCLPKTCNMDATAACMLGGPQLQHACGTSSICVPEAET